MSCCWLKKEVRGVHWVGDNVAPSTRREMIDEDENLAHLIVCHKPRQSSTPRRRPVGADARSIERALKLGLGLRILDKGDDKLARAKDRIGASCPEMRMGWGGQEWDIRI